MAKKERAARPVLAIPVHGLEERDYPFEFSPRPEELGLEDAYQGTLEVSGSVSKLGAQYRVNGIVKGVRIGECDRCLCATSDSVEAPFELVYSTGERDVDEEGILPLQGEGNDIVLDSEVRQALRLMIPMKNLCREDCRGLCPTCGTDLNEGECTCAAQDIDPRWAKLQGLLGDGPDSN